MFAKEEKPISDILTNRDKVITTPEEIFDVLSKLNISKSPNPDGIHPMVLKELAHKLSEPLAIIFSTSARLGNIPDDCKIR